MITIDDTLPGSRLDAVNQGWQPLNEGACRSVWWRPEQPDRVLKLATGRNYEQDNPAEVRAWEAMAGGPFAHMLAPIVARRADYFALLMVRERIVAEGTSTFGHRRGAPPRPWPTPYPAALRRVADLLDVADLHRWNMSGIIDDYGNVVAGRLIDYTH